MDRLLLSLVSKFFISDLFKRAMEKYDNLKEQINMHNFKNLSVHTMMDAVPTGTADDDKVSGTIRKSAVC